MADPLVLEIPIPLCEKHLKAHEHKFGVLTCNGWFYIAIGVECGSLKCRECNDTLYLPAPYLSRADLSRADLSGANLSGANLSRANLYGADLSRADLSRANLYGADLYGANLSGADLYGADLSGADLYGADLYGADLYGAVFNEWTRGLDALTEVQKKIMRKI